MTDAEPFPRYPFASVVPHTGAMVLLDQVDYWDEEQLQASVTIRPDAPFVEAQGMPAWIGIELMAQSIAALAGCRARRAQQPVRIGFLVGSRRYSASCANFPLAAQLQVQVKEIVTGDLGLSVFECRLQGTGAHSDISASANINVFQPEDPEQFLAAGQAG
ncbi:MAG TPA: hotdog family protein [Chitinolyticbacter sp.]|nr:hotdog family protein [Chitinolyticbacter sp.]